MSAPARLHRIGSDAFSVGIALTSALIGGGVFSQLGLPMPWLLGSIVGTAAPSMAGLPARVPGPLRSLVLVILGLMIGATLKPEVLGDIAQWPISLIGVLIYVMTATAAQYVFFRRVGGYDAATAYFAAAPGGFMAMTVIGGEFGGQERIIALTQAVRVVLVVFIIVLGYHLIVGHGGARTNGYVPMATLSLAQVGALLAVGAVGCAGARLLRLPASTMLGPLILMGAVQIAGLMSVHVPTGPILIAEVVLGSSIGAQFEGVSGAELGRGFLLSVSGTLVLLLLTVVFSLALRALTGMPLAALMLAFSPGGMSGISLIALALNIEPAFVTVHNMARMVVILIAGPALFRAQKANR